MHLIIFYKVVFMAKNREFHMLRNCFLKIFFAPNSVMILIIIAIFNCISVVVFAVASRGKLLYKDFHMSDSIAEFC